MTSPIPTVVSRDDPDTNWEVNFDVDGRRPHAFERFGLHPVCAVADCPTDLLDWDGDHVGHPIHDVAYIAWSWWIFDLVRRAVRKAGV